MLTAIGVGESEGYASHGELQRAIEVMTSCPQVPEQAADAPSISGVIIQLHFLAGNSSCLEDVNSLMVKCSVGERTVLPTIV